MSTDKNKFTPFDLFMFWLATVYFIGSALYLYQNR